MDAFPPPQFPPPQFPMPGPASTRPPAKVLIPIGIVAVVVVAIGGFVIGGGFAPSATGSPGPSVAHVASPSTSAPPTLTASPSASAGSNNGPSPSPSASPIAVVDHGIVFGKAGPANIYLIPPGGGRARELTHGPSINSGPSWSPAGDAIAWANRTRAGVPSELFTMSMSDLKPVRLTTGANIIRSPTWAPNGARIAFTATFSQNNSVAAQIWVVAYPAGGTPQQLTKVDRGAIAPAWSPDGHALLFVSSDSAGKPQIWRIDPDNASAAPTQLTNLPAISEYPAWSPDGTKIAFDSDRDGHLRVWVMDANGANARPVSPASMSASRPSWSPDGMRLAFEAPKGTDTEIFVMPVDGSSVPVDMSKDPGRADHAPSWR